MYLRIRSINGTFRTSLLLGKSEVAPLKPTSIPRLELAAALLLANCIVIVQEALSLKHILCHCWTDSTVTLTWISHHPSKWKPYVANRVYEIQTRLPQASWHVPTSVNPTDLASRGRSAVGFENCSLWWSGLEWLRLSDDQWTKAPKSSPPSSDISEERSCVSNIK